jgi:hypothetical protein
MAEYATKPTAEQLASLLRTRTVDEYGKEAGEFTTSTSPTLVEANQMIDAAYDLVNLRVGKIPDVPDLANQAKSVVLLLAARLVETVYYPEQVTSDQSAAALYGDLYEDAIRSLEQSVRDDRAGASFITSIPLKGLAAADVDVLDAFGYQRDEDDPI